MRHHFTKGDAAHMRWGFEGSEALRSPFPWIALTASLALTAAGWVGLERNRYNDCLLYTSPSPRD